MLKKLCLLMLIWIGMTPSVGFAMTERQATVATYAPLATALGAAALKRGDDRAVAWIVGAGALATMGTRWICSRLTPSGRVDRAKLMIEAAAELKNRNPNMYTRQVGFYVSEEANRLLCAARRDGACSSDLTNFKERIKDLSNGVWHGDKSRNNFAVYKSAANDIYRKAFFGRWFLRL